MLVAGVSLYTVQKVLFPLNKDAAARRRFATERDALLAEYALTKEERRALAGADVGRPHLMGVHPLLLAPFAGRSGLKWPDYLAALARARDAEDLENPIQDPPQINADEFPCYRRYGSYYLCVSACICGSIQPLAMPLVIISAEHFTNFFMDNMPAFCFGLAEDYPGPAEDEPFLKIAKTRVPGAGTLSRALAAAVIEDVDIAHSEELVLDHGFMVPLHLLTPRMNVPIVPIVINTLAPPRPGLKRCYALGRSLRRAIDARPERIGLLAGGGLSHWPAVPESGQLNVDWDRAFLEDFLAHRRDALTRYTEDEIERDAGPGGHEVRAWIVVSAATEGAAGETLCFEPIPAYAVTGCIATMGV